MYFKCNTTLRVGSLNSYSKCAEFLPEHNGVIIFTIGQLLRLIFVKIWTNGKLHLYIKNIILNTRNCDKTTNKFTRPRKL